MQTEQKKSDQDKYTSGGSFEMKSGKTTYKVNVFFNTEKNITIEEKLKKMIREDVKRGNF